jgi:hypothetical protein
MHPSKSRAFQQYQVHGNGTVVWKISMWFVIKQKEHSLIDRLDFEFLFNLQMVLSIKVQSLSCIRYRNDGIASIKSYSLDVFQE